MMTKLTAGAVAAFALPSIACAQTRAAPVLASASVARPSRSTDAPAAYPAGDEAHVVRFVFALTASDGSPAPPVTSFTLNLEERHQGEISLGKNVPLVTSPARQDVGLKVKAKYRMVGEDVLLDAVVEMSAMEPGSTIRKVVVVSSALASPGKQTSVLSLDDDKHHYELSVTPEKIR